MGQKSSIGQWAAGLVLLGASGILAAWLLGPWSTYADAFSHLLGHAGGGIVAAVLALLWRRRALLVLAAVCATTLALHAGLAWQASSQVSIAPAAGQLKIVSFNTWHANEDLDRLQRFIEHEDADVVLLYEFGPSKLDLIERLKARYPFATGCAETWHCSIAIFAKRPFASSDVGRREAFDGPPRVIVTLAAGSQPLTIVGAHIMRPIDGPNGHVKELRRLAGIARQTAGPLIVAGDFNATSWSHSFAVFRDESGLTHMGRFLPSWPSASRGWPQLNIDHLWVSKDLAVVDVHLGPDVGSDHRPLVAIVSLPEGTAW